MGALVMGFGHERTVMIGHQAGRCSAKPARPVAPASRQLHGQKRSVNLAPSNMEQVPLEVCFK